MRSVTGTNPARPWRRLLMALTLVVTCQFLLGSALHVHSLDDCGGSGFVHFDYHELDDIHPDQIQVTPDKLGKAFADGIEHPHLPSVILPSFWPAESALRTPAPDADSPPLSQYPLRPHTRAPPIS